MTDESSADGEVQDRYFVRALARGLEVLSCFQRDESSLSLAEIAERLGWARNVPFRYLYTLEQLGYIRRDPVTKRYSLTLRVLDFGFQAMAQLGWREIAQPYLDELRDLTGASCHLGVLDGGDVVYVARAASRLMLSSTIQLGSRLPAHATAIGKVLLAAMSDEEIGGWLRHADLNKYTSTTLSQSKLLAELAEIRKHGYAVSNGEFEEGIRSVSAPVANPRGRAVAAINASGPSSVLSEQDLVGAAAEAVRDAAQELSKASQWWEDR